MRKYLQSLPNYQLSDKADVAVYDLCGKAGPVQGVADLRLSPPPSLSLTSRIKHTAVSLGLTDLPYGYG